jgi:hypothetical protein
MVVSQDVVLKIAIIAHINPFYLNIFCVAQSMIISVSAGISK